MTKTTKQIEYHKRPPERKIGDPINEDFKINYNILREEIIETLMKYHPTVFNHYVLSENNYFVYFDDKEGHYVIDKDDAEIINFIAGYLENLGLLTYVNSKFIPEVISKYRQVMNMMSRYLSLNDFNNFSKLTRNKKENKLYINFSNGTLIYNLKTKTKKLVKHTHSSRFLSKLNVNYEEEAKCSLWVKALSEIIPSEEDRQLVRCFLAYSLISKFFDWECMFFAYGIGYNGKGTVFKTWSSIFNRVSTTKLSDIAGKNGRATIYQKDFVFADESDDTPQTMSDLKAIASGDEVLIDIKYVPQFNTLLDTKIVAASNRLPRLKTLGDRRRFLFIRFPINFSGKDNLDLKRSLKDNELPGIVNWAIDIIPEFLEKLPILKRDLDHRTKLFYEKLSDPFGLWCDGIIQAADNAETTTDELTQCYNIWALHYGHDSINKRSVAIKFGRFFDIKATRITRSHRGFQGYAINEIEMVKIIGKNNWRELPEETIREGSMSQFIDDENGDPFHLQLLKWMVNENRLLSFQEINKKAREFGLGPTDMTHWIKQWKIDGVVSKPKQGYYGVTKK